MKVTATPTTTPADRTEKIVAQRILPLFRNGAPLGFQAGDENLYRYVNNGPTNATDPSGLSPWQFFTEQAQESNWHFWATQPRQQLDISGTQDRAAVLRAINALNTTFRLTNIPWVDPRLPVIPSGATGRPTPPQFIVRPDQAATISDPRTGTGVFQRMDQITSAQLARINLRVNLLRIKQALVTQLYLLVMNNPPPGRRLNPDAVTSVANQTADLLIRLTDRFLSEHSGARPRLGNRGAFFTELGTNRFTHPWCADWAEAMDAWIGRQVRNNLTNPINAYYSFDWGQANNRGQHNFIIVRPTWYNNIRLSVPGNDAVDPVILLFDPWRDLMPRLYRPAPLSRGNLAPTNLFNRNRLEHPYYWEHDP